MAGEKSEGRGEERERRGKEKGVGERRNQWLKKEKDHLAKGGEIS